MSACEFSAHGGCNRLAKMAWDGNSCAACLHNWLSRSFGKLGQSPFTTLFVYFVVVHHSPAARRLNERAKQWNLSRLLWSTLKNMETGQRAVISTSLPMRFPRDCNQQTRSRPWKTTKRLTTARRRDGQILKDVRTPGAARPRQGVVRGAAAPQSADSGQRNGHHWFCWRAILMLQV